MNTPTRCANFLTATSSSDPEFVAAMNTANPPNYLWLTPNDCNNMHSCSIATGDSYLATLVPKILSSTEFTTTKATLLIVYDEGYTQCSNTGGTGECVYASFSGPVAKKVVQLSPTGASHYSYLSTIEAAWGLASLTSNDAGAPNMLGAFGSTCATSCPPPPLSTSFTTSPSTPLVNAAVTFTATTTGGTAPYALSWSFGDGASGIGASITHIYTTVQSFIVTETATDSSSPSQTATSSKTVVVVAPAPLSTSFNFLPTGPLVNLPVSFTAVTTGGTSPYSIAWVFGDGTTGSGAVTTHTYTAAQPFTVTETAKDSSSLSQTATSIQKVTVFTSPPLTLTTPRNQTVTAGTWINFTITATDINLSRTITLSATSLPAGATFNPATGFFSWKPSSSQAGYYTINFTATDNGTPAMSASKPVGIQVERAAPGGSGGGSGGSNGGCALCGIIPRISTSMWLLVIGGLMGLVASLALVTIKARANLERTKRRMRQLNR
jgi:hypothetical protein